MFILVSLLKRFCFFNQLINSFWLLFGYYSGVTVKLPGISCNGNKVQVHGLDIVEGKINNDDASVLRDTGCSTAFVHSEFTNTDHLTKNL
jgi:hypothetical protein